MVSTESFLTNSQGVIQKTCSLSVLPLVSAACTERLVTKQTDPGVSVEESCGRWYRQTPSVLGGCCTISVRHLQVCLHIAHPFFDQPIFHFFFFYISPFFLCFKTVIQSASYLMSFLRTLAKTMTSTKYG